MRARALSVAACLLLLPGLVVACSHDAATSATPTPTPSKPVPVTTEPRSTPSPLPTVTLLEAYPELWNALVRPVIEGDPETVVRLAATVPALCSFHGSLHEVCERRGKGLYDHFEGIVFSDAMFCEGCAQAPEEAIATLEPIYSLGRIELQGVWRVTPNIGAKLAGYREGLTATLAIALVVPGAGDADRPTGFLLYVDPTVLGDPEATPISAIELLTPTWTGFRAAEYLGAWEQLYPSP